MQTASDSFARGGAAAACYVIGLAAYSAESVLIEIIFIVGPPLVALFVAFASAAAAVWFAAACGFVGRLVFRRWSA